jgi:hypothetical protein
VQFKHSSVIIFYICAEQLGFVATKACTKRVQTVWGCGDSIKIQQSAIYSTSENTVLLGLGPI